MHHLYIIFSSAIDKYYVGETSNFQDRINQHNSSFFKKSYTSVANDWKPVLLIEFDNISQAKKAEAFIKKMNSREFILRLIQDHQWLIDRFKT